MKNIEWRLGKDLSVPYLFLSYLPTFPPSLPVSFFPSHRPSFVFVHPFMYFTEWKTLKFNKFKQKIIYIGITLR